MRTLTCILLLACFAACNGPNEQKVQHVVSADAMKLEAPAAPDAAMHEELTKAQLSGNGSGSGVAGDVQVTVPAKQIIYRADMRIQVKNVDEAVAHIKSKLAASGAYIASSELTRDNTHIENRLVIRVPAKHFEHLLDAAGQEAAYVQYRNITSEDVTEEYVDLNIRLKNKKEVEQRYIDILRTKARTVKDVLEAEEKLRVIREEIESAEGRLRYLQSQVAYSTITLNCYQVVEFKAAPEQLKYSFWSELGESLKGGFGMIKSLLLGIISIWPVVLILVAVFWYIRRWHRRRGE